MFVVPFTRPLHQPPAGTSRVDSHTLRIRGGAPGDARRAVIGGGDPPTTTSERAVFDGAAHAHKHAELTNAVNAIRMRSAGSQPRDANPGAMKRFDWAMAVAGYWTLVGLYADAGWHIRNDVDSFFTWSHAILYSGLALLLAIIARFAIGRPHFARDRSLTVVGAVLFLAGGIADLVNHLFFGFEAGFDALLSPTHQIIGAGVLLIVTSPIRSGLQLRPQRFVDQIPIVISAASVLELLHWGTNVFYRSDAQTALGVVVPHELTADAITLATLHFYGQGAGLVAAMLQSLLMMGILFYLLRNFELRPPAITMLFILGNILISISHALSWRETAAWMFASVVAGLFADALASRNLLDRRSVNVFAFAVPAIYQGALLAATAALLGGVWWDPLFLTGTILYSGLFSLFLGLVAFAGPNHSQAQ